jgi:hypothetical protein
MNRREVSWFALAIGTSALPLRGWAQASSPVIRRVGNVTGISAGIGASLPPKRLELVREIMPGIKRLGLLGEPNDPSTRLDRQALAPLGKSLGVTIIFAEASNPLEFDSAVATLIVARVEAIFAAGSALADNMRVRLTSTAMRPRAYRISHACRNLWAISDRSDLQQRVCECYEMVEWASSRLLSHAPAA